MNKSDLKFLKKEERLLRTEVERVENAEEKIEEEEKEILQIEKKILKKIELNPERLLRADKFIIRRLYYLKSIYIKKIARHKIPFALIVTTGVVLVWRGIWVAADMIPILSYASVSLIVGIIILCIVDKYSHL